MSTRHVSHAKVAAAGAAGALLFVGWLIWPYLHAIVVRDAAVTTWISMSAAPIAGYTTNPLLPGQRTGEDGRIATVSDPRADRTPLALADAELARARARVLEQESVIEAAQQAVDVRATHASDFGATFTRDMDEAVTGATSSLAFLRQQLDLERKEADRVSAVSRAGAASQSEVDAANAAVAGRQHQIADLEAFLRRADERRRSAKGGVFLLEDGTDGNSTFQNLADARLRVLQARQTLTQLRAAEQAAHAVVEAARLAFEKAHALDVVVPPGSMVWSLSSSPGEPVQPGTPIASWVDCHVMLVDAPVSDVETSLLHIGSIAHVAVEGEREVRTGTVILTRGSAGVLGENDLAALAKGRRPGIGQALVQLEPTPHDVEACIIGHAAYVDFPEVGVIDLMRARLRF